MTTTEERIQAMILIAEATLAGARQGEACSIIGIDERTLRRWEKQQREGRLNDRRTETKNTPANRLTEEEKTSILEVCNRPEYQSLPPSQIVPILADEGQFIASESSYYRVLREAEQVNRRGRAKAPRIVEKPKGYQAQRPNQIWSWDITYLASSVRGLFYYLYLIVDIYSRKIVGWDIHAEENTTYSSRLIRQACLAENIKENELVLHSDNGGPMKGATMLATLEWLGVIPSLSRPSVSNDNPYSESLFRHLKYRPSYPSRPFEDIDVARLWVNEFVQWYNHEHRHSAIRFVTPVQRHLGEDKAILVRREQLYQEAKQANPSRWSGETRNWTPIDSVWLNPPKEKCPS